jgi:hypothetical protein
LKPGNHAGLTDKEAAMAKKPTKTARSSKKPLAKPETKQNIVLAMLRRARGATIVEIVEATGWQAHSVRGFFAGALKKRLKIAVVSEKDAETGERRYFVAALRASK